MADYRAQIRQQKEYQKKVTAQSKQLQSRISELSTRKRNLEQRKSEIEDILATVSRGLNRSAEDVRTVQNSLVSDIDRAIKMVGVTDDLISEVRGSLINVLPDESEGMQMVSALTAELQNIEDSLFQTNSSISAANDQIRENNSKIQTANENIKALKRRQAEE
jgi:chromosome segregation ATPase